MLATPEEGAVTGHAAIAGAGQGPENSALPQTPAASACRGRRSSGWTISMETDADDGTATQAPGWTPY